jgi:hypothetical protein
MEKMDCGEFFLQGSAPPADSRFRWGCRFQTYAVPVRRVLISVGPKGEQGTSFLMPSPDEATTGGAAAGAAAPAAPAESPR